MVSLLYNLPRAYLNVHIFGSICSLYNNVILGQYLPQDRRSIQLHPRHSIHDETLPPYLLKYVNSPREVDFLYELQHTTMNLPFYHTSPMCSYHLDRMRGSLAYQLYFVISDCLFLVIIIISITYSTLFFFLEVKKCKKFRESAALGTKNNKPRRFWTLPHLSIVFNVVLTIAVLVSQILFTVYWLIIDFDGVFLIEIIRYIELFYFYSLTFYLAVLSLIKLLLLKVSNM